MAQTSFSNYLTLVEVKGQSQMNVMMVHCTPSNGHAPTYKISLTYLERQKSNGPHKLLHLFDLGVKGQGLTNVMMVCDTPSYASHSLTYLSLKTKQIMVRTSFAEKRKKRKQRRRKKQTKTVCLPSNGIV